MARSRLAPLLLLVGYGVVFGAVAFGLDTPAFDDHPGQLFRLHHLIARGPAPWAWNPDWWAGYPELQFYPPGYFYLGAFAVWGTLGAVPIDAAYRGLLWITFLAPAVTSFLVLARVLRSGWFALPGAFVALTLSAGLTSGLEGGVHIGMLPARLGWALLPVLVLVLDSRVARGGRFWLAAPVMAAIVLIHPTHGPAAVALIAVAAAAGDGPWPRRVSGAVALLALAAALTAFWTVPLLARLAHTRALAWGRVAPLEILTTFPLLAILLGLALLGSRAAGSSLATAMARWPLVALTLVLADALALEPLGLRWLPADRIVDGAWMAILLSAGLVGGRWLERAPPRWPPMVLALGAVGLVAALGFSDRTLTVWPRAAEWPSLAIVERGLRLESLWTSLRRAPEGRALFVRSAVPLVYGPEWWRPHTHVTALAPLRADRPIVNGTFTHPSPVAALLYRGDAGPGAITTLVERLDGRVLFGRPLESLDAGTLAAYADRLGVSVIVALDEDVPRLRALEDQSAFRRRATVGPFWIYEGLRPMPLPIPAGPGRWVVMLEGEREAWAPARVTYSPLWRAERQGAPLQTRRGPVWDLEVRLDGLPGPVTLVYAAGIPERSGLIVTVLAAVVWVGLVCRQRGLRP